MFHLLRRFGGHALLADYGKVLSGSVGRLVISVVYFLIAANALTLEQFGLFATGSAVGVVLARVAAFGFMSPLFRTATMRRRILGTYLAGYGVLLLASLPVVAGLGLAVHAIVFGATMSLGVLAMLVAAEVLGWRTLEAVVIVNNGLRRFGRAALLVLLGSAIRTLFAVLFWLAGQHGLETWAATYLAANLVSALLALLVFLPSVRWRWRPALYGRRMMDALAAAAAEMVFYVQAEIDKAVVLSFAGPRVAGLYAIALRIIDLTALPVRAFNQLLIQKIMGDRGFRAGFLRRAGIELAIAAVSVGALIGVIVLTVIWPGLLGRNITQAAMLFPVLLLVPAFRNLVEYHAELLYAHERGGVRVAVLLVAGALKVVLMIWAITATPATDEAAAIGWFVWMNAIFAAIWALSALVSYRALSAPRHAALHHAARGRRA